MLGSWEALTPELAASGGGSGCRTCLDIAWLSCVVTLVTFLPALLWQSTDGVLVSGPAE